VPYTLEQKLVVAIASSALFDLSESDKVFRDQGEEAYREHQREHENEVLAPGVAFQFIKRLLAINDDNGGLVEVILLSRNDPDTGLRVFNSIEHYGLDISRAAFVSGQHPFRYIPAFHVCLFLSANEEDVKEAIMAGHPAGRVLHGRHADDPNDRELRIAFDFDAVIIDDEPERVYRDGGLERFHQSESEKAQQPHTPGPLCDLLFKIAAIQQADREQARKDPSYVRRVRIAVITSRNAPAHKRMVTTLRAWRIQVDETFLLGGLDKRRVLEEFNPHVFFDDQRIYLDAIAGVVPCVHVPFGVRNEQSVQPEDAV
jgi:5'-nucleotidase